MQRSRQWHRQLHALSISINWDTPSLVIDKTALARNIQRMNLRAESLNVVLRPHVKTTKSIDVSKQITPSTDAPITVSTLTEAEYFADAGYTNILYAVSFSPSKLDRLTALYDRGVQVTIILDDKSSAEQIIQGASHFPSPLRVMIEIDTDGHRAGLEPDDPVLLSIGEILHADSHIEFVGVITHAGESYECDSLEAIEKHA